jgi:imidazolonepropionase-like amidohydrolase
MVVRALLAVFLFVSATSLIPAQSADIPFVIREVRVFDGDTVAERQTVVISQGRIIAVGRSVAVPAGAQEIAGENRTLLPGLIDAHVHFPIFPVTAAAEALQQSLAFGVTTSIVMGAAPSQVVARLKALEDADSPDIAAILDAGIYATAPGGHPTQMGGPGFPTLSSPGEADAFVAARLAEGSDFLKIIYDDVERFGKKLPTLDEATIAALVTAAHARGKIAVAHIGDERTARGALGAGVDGLAHLFEGSTVSSDFGQFAAKHGVFVIPTLSVLYSSCGMPDAPGFLKDADTMKRVLPRFRSFLEMPTSPSTLRCEAAPQAIRQLAAANVPLLTGTDAPAPGTMYGASVHKELEHLVDAGLTPMAALVAATSAPAKAFRMTDRGRIKSGMRADLLLVDGDPSKQIRATQNIVAVWKRGVRLQQTP